MTIDGFHHVMIRSADWERSIQFYRALGLAERMRWGEGDNRAIMLDAGRGNYIEIFAGGEEDQGFETALRHFALRTPDVDAAVEIAVAAGAEVTVQPKDVNIPSTPGPTPVRIAFVRGPDGEVIEFFQDKQEARA